MLMAKPEMPTLRQEVPSNPLLIRPALGEIENSDVWWSGALRYATLRFGC